MESFKSKWLFNGVPQRPNNIDPVRFNAYDVYTSVIKTMPAYIMDKDASFDEGSGYNPANLEKFNYFINLNDGMRLSRYVIKELKKNGYTFHHIFSPVVEDTIIKSDGYYNERISFFIIHNEKDNNRAVIKLLIMSSYKNKRSEKESIKTLMRNQYGDNYIEKKSDYTININFCSSDWKIHNFLLKLYKKINDEFHIGNDPEQPSSPLKTINLLIQTMHGFNVYPYKFEDKDNLYSGKEDLIKLNYGSSFVETDTFIKSSLNDHSKSGLYIFDGPPGTGKSSYIKHLFSTVQRNFYYIPLSLSDGGFDNPGVINFFLENPNGVYVIEDAERLVQKRSGDSNNSGISSLLNMSDGILSSLLNIQFIITFNTSIDDVDSALFRSGRLIHHHHFGYLDKQDVDYFFTYHGKIYTQHEPTMRLCDMYKAVGR